MLEFIVRHPQAVTAIATGVIALFSLFSFFLTLKIIAKDYEYRQQTGELFQAIAVSNMLSGPDRSGSRDLEERVKLFNKWYKGDIQIFPREHYFE